MKTGSPGIPLNCSICVPICRSIKRALMMFHEKHTIEKKSAWLHFFVLKVSNNHSCLLIGFCFA